MPVPIRKDLTASRRLSNSKVGDKVTMSINGQNILRLITRRTRKWVLVGDFVYDLDGQPARAIDATSDVGRGEILPFAEPEIDKPGC